MEKRKLTCVGNLVLLILRPHPVLEKLENIKPVFLPANTTSMLQPMDQGVIRSLKCHYRKLILLRMMECIEKRQDQAVTLLVAIRCVEKTRRRAADRITHNCGSHAGILSAQGVSVTENEDDVEV
jgi:hypothetical protein